MKRSKFILAVGALLLLGACSFSSKDRLEVSFLAVGQGDAILIEAPEGRDILIDGGPDSSIIYELGRALPFYDRSIELMILTHPHADHLMGLIEVMDRYEVKTVMHTGVAYDSSAYSKWLEMIEKEGAIEKIAAGPQKIILGDGASLEILWPRSDIKGRKIDDLNNTSIVAKLEYKENSFLLTGDIEKEIEEKLLGSDAELEADILKAAHHGSDTSTTGDFLKAVSPKAAVICVGDNDFGFPSQKVLEQLKKRSVSIFRTDESSVVFSGDGETLSVK